MAILQTLVGRKKPMSVVIKESGTCFNQAKPLIDMLEVKDYLIRMPSKDNRETCRLGLTVKAFQLLKPWNEIMLALKRDGLIDNGQSDKQRIRVDIQAN